MSEFDDEEAETHGDHIERFLAPTEHIHPSATFINKGEQLPLAVYEVLAGVVKKAKDHINKGKPEKVSDDILDGVDGVIRWYLDMGASVDGKRSKQLTKINASNRFVPTEETKEGRLERIKNRFRKKEDLSSDG